MLPVPVGLLAIPPLAAVAVFVRFHPGRSPSTMVLCLSAKVASIIGRVGDAVHATIECKVASALK
jgi:hypothetical protein